MKKYIIGAIVGSLLSFSASAYGEGLIDMIGKKVDGALPFKINGKRVDKDVIVIEGISYLPVRAAADLFSYNIEYDTANKEVLMQSKKYSGLTDLEKAIRNMTIVNYTANVDGIVNTDEKISMLQYNNEIYVPLAPIFVKVANYDGTNLTISLNGKTITATKNSTEKDQAFIVDGIFYVKLSALDLKTTIQENTLIIEPIVSSRK